MASRFGAVVFCGAVAVVSALAFAARLRLLSAGVGLAASDGYDDGVYFAAADALVHGRLPYRDFLLLHPPGIVLALSPFAALASVIGDHYAVGVARLFFIGIGTLNTGLVMVLARRQSAAAAITAGLIAAATFSLALAERSTLLEPLGSCLVLTAMVLVRRAGSARYLTAGVLMGAATMVKIWYVVPLVVVLIFSTGRRRRFLLGAVIGASAVGGPFFLAAPWPMLREVVLDQLGRPRGGTGGLLHRIMVIVGDPFIGVRLDATRTASTWVGVALAVLAVAGAVVLLRTRWSRVYAVQLAASFAVVLAGPSFFVHYAAFVVPWLAICIGVGASMALGPVRVVWVRAAAPIGLGMLIASVNVPSLLNVTPTPQPVLQLRPLLAAAPGCVISDDPGLLADGDVLTRDLVRGCPLWPDVTGWTYDRDKQPGVARARNAVWQRDVLRYLLSGQSVILARAGTGLSPASEALIAALPVRGAAGSLVLHTVPGH